MRSKAITFLLAASSLLLGCSDTAEEEAKIDISSEDTTGDTSDEDVKNDIFEYIEKSRILPGIKELRANGDGSVTLFHADNGSGSMMRNESNSLVGEATLEINNWCTLSDGFHGFRRYEFRGVREGRLVFAVTDRFSFGGEVSEKTKTVEVFEYSETRPPASRDDPWQYAEGVRMSVDELKQRYEVFASSLNPERFAEGYPALIKKLDSQNSEEREIALRMMGSSADIDAIPLLVPLILHDNDRSVRTTAGFALERIVTSNELKRRDLNSPQGIVLFPRSEKDVDLRPVAWVLQEMLAKPETASTHAYAATMIGYLGLRQFEPQLRKLLGSRHPAVTRSAVHALRMLGCEVKDEPHPIK